LRREKVDSLGREVDGLDLKVNRLARNLPTVVGDVMRQVSARARRKGLITGAINHTRQRNLHLVSLRCTKAMRIRLGRTDDRHYGSRPFERWTIFGLSAA
jgi:hypothetical protein